MSVMGMITENGQDVNPWAAVGMAFAKQQGVDGKWYVSLHLGSAVMSVVVLMPADSVDAAVEEMSKSMKKLGMECRLSNKGIVTG